MIFSSAFLLDIGLPEPSSALATVHFCQTLFGRLIFRVGTDVTFATINYLMLALGIDGTKTT